MRCERFHAARRRLLAVLYEKWQWLVIVYARREFRYPWGYLIRTWMQVRATGRKGVFGQELTRMDEFFAVIIDREHAEARIYTCVYGACSVIWHPLRGNLGGGGRPGCPCEALDDPRDLASVRPSSRALPRTRKDIS